MIGELQLLHEGHSLLRKGLIILKTFILGIHIAEVSSGLWNWWSEVMSLVQYFFVFAWEGTMNKRKENMWKKWPWVIKIIFISYKMNGEYLEAETLRFLLCCDTSSDNNHFCYYSHSETCSIIDTFSSISISNPVIISYFSFNEFVYKFTACKLPVAFFMVLLSLVNYIIALMSVLLTVRHSYPHNAFLSRIHGQLFVI